jgi:putative oxidoreductase
MPDRIFVAVHRLDETVYYRRLAHQEYFVLKAISGQISIREAIEGAFEASSASVEEQQTMLEEWFANWARLGWCARSIQRRGMGDYERTGIPAPALNAWFVSGLEFAGGLMLIVGLGSRLVALPLVIDMIVVYITTDREALFSIVSSPDKFMAAAPFTFLVASLIILIFGPGKASVDALLVGRLWGRRIARDFSGSRALAQN